jgi:hypothetical protein
MKKLREQMERIQTLFEQQEQSLIEDIKRLDQSIELEPKDNLIKSRKLKQELLNSLQEVKRG